MVGAIYSSTAAALVSVPSKCRSCLSLYFCNATIEYARQCPFTVGGSLAKIMFRKLCLDLNIFTELANTMKYVGGCYITLFSSSSNFKRFPVTSLRFIEYGVTAGQLR